MPAILTHAPTETVRKDTGSGGRPPVYHRPTGGWGGGDESGDREPRRHPRELLERYRLGLGFALAFDAIFFILLAIVLFAQQHAGRLSPDGRYFPELESLAIPPILWVNTAILLLSTCTMEIARRGVFQEIGAMEEWFGLGRPVSRRAVPWLVATAALGSLFLAGQWIAWRQLHAQGIYFVSNLSSHLFYMITGADAVHVFFGVFGVAVVATAMIRSHKRLELRQIAVDTAGWYWHAMSVLWLCLFGLLLLSQ